MSDDDADSSKEEGERVHDFSSVESEREGSSSTEEVDADEDDEDENVTAADSNLPFNVVLIIYLIQRIKREVVGLFANAREYESEGSLSKVIAKRTAQHIRQLEEKQKAVAEAEAN